MIFRKNFESKELFLKMTKKKGTSQRFRASESLRARFKTQKTFCKGDKYHKLDKLQQ